MREKKIKKKTTLLSKDKLDEKDLDAFMEAIDHMDPGEAGIILKNLISVIEEEGEQVPFSIRLLTSDILFGMSQTPVGLAYGIGNSGQLMLTGFILSEMIEELGSAETILQMIIEDFEETISIAQTVRDDEAIGALLKSALEGSYQMNKDLFEVMAATDLQRTVWNELLKIPYGQTISYEELALRVGKPKAVRAVATAVGDNPLAIVIPCHRIILKSGKIGKYHWGSDLKEKLLSYEKAHK